MLAEIEFFRTFFFITYFPTFMKARVIILLQMGWWNGKNIFPGLSFILFTCVSLDVYDIRI